MHELDKKHEVETKQPDTDTRQTVISDIRYSDGIRRQMIYSRERPRYSMKDLGYKGF